MLVTSILHDVHVNPFAISQATFQIFIKLTDVKPNKGGKNSFS